MVSQDPYTPDPLPEGADDAPKPAGPEAGAAGWRWWFAAVGPWVGVAAAIVAIVLRR